MVRFLVQRPVAIFVTFFALLILGITAFLMLPISLLPKVDIPIIVVRTNAPDFSAQEIEEHLTKPIRNNLIQIRGLKNIESTTAEGLGTIRLQFEQGVDISMAFIDVNEKVDMAMNSLPRDVPRPIVAKSSVSDIPVFRLNISPKEGQPTVARMAEVSSFAREVVRRRIEQLPDVGMVDITGFLQAQIEVIPKVGYLESIGLNSDVLLRAFRENRISLGNILVKDGHYRYYLSFSEELQDLKALANTPLNINGRLFQLSDLAGISYTTKESTGFYYSREKQAINFAVIKQSAARMDDLKKNFNDLLSRMKEDYPTMDFEVTQDQTKLLDYSISNLQQDLFLGGCLAFLLMLIFIRKIRMAMLIGITIPLSLIISQLGFYLLDVSLNIISLGGLILGLSMIIDNSIVVMDTISGYRDRGFSALESAVQGTNEIIRPLITSVLTNCAVFIPLIFLSGLAGVIFYDQAISIVVGVMASLIVAIIFLPPLFKLIYPERTEKTVKTRFEIKPVVNIVAVYDKILHWCFRYPLVLTTLVVLFVVVGGLVFIVLKKDRLPTITRNDFEVFVDWNEYLTENESRRRIENLAKEIEDKTLSMNTWSGMQQYLLPVIENLGYGQNRIYIQVSDSDKLHLIQEEVRQHLQERYPEVTITFHHAQNAFDAVFSTESAPLILQLSGKDQRKMPDMKIAKETISGLAEVLPHAKVNPIGLYEKIVIELDYETASRYFVTADQVADKIASIFRNQKIANFQAAESLIPLVLATDRPSSIYNMLQQTFIINKHQQQIPLSALVKESKKKEYKYITAGIAGEFYPVDIFTSTPEDDLKKITKLLQSFEDKLDIVITGSYFENKQLIIDMAIVLAISILLLYFILAAQFESLIQPLFILVELPVAICGAFIFLYVGNSSLNLMSMIGIVVMSGLIINDSILKIDAINQLRKKGTPLMEAIFEGGHKRLHSIIMISLTSIGALAPTLVMKDLGSELQKPLALALIGGMTVGLLMSLFFVPIIYWIIYRKNNI